MWLIFHDAVQIVPKAINAAPGNNVPKIKEMAPNQPEYRMPRKLLNKTPQNNVSMIVMVVAGVRTGSSECARMETMKDKIVGNHTTLDNQKNQTEMNPRSFPKASFTQM